MPGGRELLMYTRPGCGLCDEMQAALAPWLREHSAVLTLLPIDSDPALLVSHGARIPVLILDGEEICFGRLDMDLLQEAWSGRV